MTTQERYKCDRNGGAKRAYLRRPEWVCPHCATIESYAGHRCQDCRRRVCCSCFHHDLAICLSGPGSDMGTAQMRFSIKQGGTPCPAASERS